MSHHEGTALHAKLVVHDADAAIACYRTVFGAELEQRYTAGGQVVFAELRMLGTAVQVKDEDQHDPSPRTLGRPGVLLDVVTGDPDALAERMVQAGGEVVFPVSDQPYGPRQGRVRDPFGHEWLVGTPLQTPPEEVQASLDRLVDGE